MSVSPSTFNDALKARFLPQLRRTANTRAARLDIHHVPARVGYCFVETCRLVTNLIGIIEELSVFLRLSTKAGRC